LTLNVCLFSANEEILDILTQPVRAEFDDWFLVYGPDKWQISTSGKDVVLWQIEIMLSD